MAIKNVITETEQARKAYLAFSPLFLGLGFILVILHFEPKGTPLLFGLLMASVFLPVAGIAYACVSIKCPSCSCRWFWKGMNMPKNDPWLTKIFTSQVCPNCNTRFGS